MLQNGERMDIVWMSTKGQVMKQDYLSNIAQTSYHIQPTLIRISYQITYIYKSFLKLSCFLLLDIGTFWTLFQCQIMFSIGKDIIGFILFIM